MIKPTTQLLEEAKEFKTIEAWLEYIENYSNLCNKDESEDSNSNAVNIVTMHASKGLEWDVVILPDVNEGTVPHKKAVTDDDIDVVFLPVNGVGNNFNMTDAARFAKETGAILEFNENAMEAYQRSNPL